MLVDFFSFFWQNLSPGSTSLYATDNTGTFFKTGVITPGRILSEVPIFDGINTPNVYIGSFGTYSALHLEDLDLYSYNIVIFGGDKVLEAFTYYIK